MEPKKGELVIVKINKVMPYGAFASLLEYPEYEGFLHIKEVASKWIKNITDYIKPGMITVARVLNVEKEKRMADISLRSVTEDARKKKLEEYENEKKAYKIIEIAYKKANAKLNKSVFDKIKKDYELVYDLLLDIQSGEVKAEEYFPKKVAKELEELVKSMIKRKEIEIRGIAEIMVLERNGIDIIKKVLGKINDNVSYLGAPKYLIKVKGEDFKEANKKMKEIKEYLEKELGKNLISFKVERLKG